MNYKSLIESIYGTSYIRSYKHTIKECASKIYIDNKETEYKSLEEAREYIKLKQLSEKLEQDVTEELYETLSTTTIANIIKEHYNIKVTDTLIESYVELASSNIFSIDPVVFSIRKLNKLDRIVEGKIHYKLDDNSFVAIDEATQEFLNNILESNQDILSYMKQNKTNFMYVLEKLEEQNGSH